MSVLRMNISAAEVYTEVEKITGYSGKKDTLDGSTYKQIAAIGANADVLDRYFSEAIETIMDLAKPYEPSMVVKRTTGNDYYFSGVLCESMPKSWDAGLSASTSQSAVSYVVSHVVAKWMRMVKASDESKYDEDEQEKLLELKRKIYYKRRPTLSMFDKADEHVTNADMLASDEKKLNGSSLPNIRLIKSDESFVLTELSKQ